MSDLSELAEELKALRGEENASLQQLAEGLRMLAPVELPSGRMQTPSERAVKAVKILLEKGGNKGDALREAGFSEGIATQPSRVFGSPTVRALMKEMGVGEGDALATVKRNLGAKSERVQLTAADMVFKLTGSYAPTRVEGKHDHRVGVFSMKDLREKMKRKGIKVVPRE